MERSNGTSDSVVYKEGSNVADSPATDALDTCEECIARAANSCDLGYKTYLTRSGGRQVRGPSGGCSKPRDMDQYLIAHLMKI